MSPFVVPFHSTTKAAPHYGQLTWALYVIIMEEHVYQSSLFWFVVTKASELAYILAIPALFAAIAIWAYKTKTKLSYVGLIGGTSLLLGHISHLIYPSVSTIALGGMQPTIDQNPFVVFFYLHGINFGTIIVGISLCVLFFKRESV